MKKKRTVPTWVLKYKIKGTEIHKRGNNYYLCKVTGVWDKKLKGPGKITGEYLGKITKEGVIPPKHKRIEHQHKQISVKEFGATYFLQYISQDIIDELKRIYPYDWKELFTLAIF